MINLNTHQTPNNKATATENFIATEHYREWQESGIAPEQTEAVLISIPPYKEPETPWEMDGDELPQAFHLLDPDGSTLEYRNDGRLTASSLKKVKAEFLVDGGWTVRNIDLETGEASAFAPYKPDSPRWDDQKQKSIKYEHPRNQSTGIFASPVTFAISLEVAVRSDDEKFQKAWLQRFREELNKEIEAEDSQSLRELDAACKRGELGKISQLFRAIRHCKGTGFEQFKFVDSPTVARVVKRIDNGFWEAVKAHPIPVCITEGVKKANSLLTQGICAIGLAGIWNWIDQDAPKFVDAKGKEKRFKELTRQIKPLTGRKREIILAFDEDTKTTTRYQVKIAQTVLGKTLSKNGCKISILSWDPEDGKGIDDAIALHGSDWLTHTWQERRSLSAWLYWHYDLSHPDQRLNQRWLTLEDIASNAKLVGIQSPKGTYKTGAMAEATTQARMNGQKILALSSREQTTENLGERLGIDTQYNQRTSPTQGELGMAVTADSLHADSQAGIRPEQWEGCILVMDEVEQVLHHTLTSTGTEIKNHREQVLTTLTLLCQVASKIYVSDADLCPGTLSYINNLAGGCSQEVIVNDYQPAAGRTAYSYDNPEDLIDQAVHAVRQGKKIHIATDSQKPQSQLGSFNLETIVKAVDPSTETLRVDQETVKNPEHPAYHFTEDKDEIIPNLQVLITSPTVSNSVSIDHHFDEVYCFGVGSISENSIRQLMERVRADADRHVWTQKIGNHKDLEGGGTDTHAVYHSQKRQTKIHKSFLSNLESDHQFDFDCHATHTKAFAETVARHNLGLSALGENVLEGMKRDGYTLKQGPRLSDEDRDLWKDVLEATRLANYQTRIQEILNASSVDHQQFQKLENQRELTDSQQRELRKGKLERTYGIEPDHELVEQDDHGLYSKLKLQFWLTVGRDRVEQRDTTQAKKHGEKTGYQPFEPDFNRNKYQAKVELLEALEIPDILEMDQITNERLQPWWERIQAKLTPHNVKTIRALTGLALSPNETPVRNLGKLLDRIGCQLQETKHSQKDKKRYRNYCIQQKNSRVTEIFSYWLSKLEKQQDPAPDFAA